MSTSHGLAMATKRPTQWSASRVSVAAQLAFMQESLTGVLVADRVAGIDHGLGVRAEHFEQCVRVFCLGGSDQRLRCLLGRCEVLL